MATVPLVGATVSIGGTSSCVENGNVNLGERQLTETTCSTDYVRTYAPGMLSRATGSVTINDSGALFDWVSAYGDGGELPAAVSIVFTWPDAGAAALTISGRITNVTTSIGTNNSLAVTVNFSSTGTVSFTA